MAKCTICNSRKGKRKCPASETFICSLCCGESRSGEKCAGCSFFSGKSAPRNYRKLPYYTINEMEASGENERISMVIENSLSLIWNRDKRQVNDHTVQRLVEMLLDQYHFGEPQNTTNETVLADGYRTLQEEIAENLGQVPAEQLVKVLGAIYRSIQRRSSGGSSYLQFINHFTGGMYMANEQ